MAAPVVMTTDMTRSVASCRSVNFAVTTQYRVRNEKYQQTRKPKAPDSSVNW